MRVYIAAPWKHKERAKEVKAQVLAAGIEVSSRWIDFEADPAIIYDYPEQVMEQEAEKDFEDILNSTHMLYLNLEKSEGKATELGMAIMCALPIYVVGGKQNNVFLHMSEEYGINHIDSVEDAIAAISR